MYKSRRRAVEIPVEFTGKLVILFLFMAMLFIAVLFLLPERKASAGDEAVKTYTITSVQIEEGDSLWAIADKYFTEEFESRQNYISEIKRMNGITSDTLYAGNYLLVPHYVQ